MIPSLGSVDPSKSKSLHVWSDAVSWVNQVVLVHVFSWVTIRQWWSPAKIIPRSRLQGSLNRCDFKSPLSVHLVGIQAFEPKFRLSGFPQMMWLGISLETWLKSMHGPLTNLTRDISRNWGRPDDTIAVYLSIMRLGRVRKALAVFMATSWDIESDVLKSGSYHRSRLQFNDPTTSPEVGVFETSWPVILHQETCTVPVCYSSTAYPWLGIQRVTGENYLLEFRRVIKKAYHLVPRRCEEY